MQNVSYKNEYDWYENEHVGAAHFLMTDFALRLVLTQTRKVTRKWPIAGRYHAYKLFSWHINTFWLLV